MGTELQIELQIAMVEMVDTVDMVDMDLNFFKIRMQ